MIKILQYYEIVENSFKDHCIKSVNFSSDNNFTFTLNKKLKISNLNLESKIDLITSYKKNLLNIKNISNFKDTVKLENHKF